MNFLRNLNYYVSFGDFYFCHAGIRPSIPLDEQTIEDLTWIRSPFLEETALYPKIIVHGHTTILEPEMKPNRINIDTFAYQTGILTALVIDYDEISFLQTSRANARIG